VTLRGFHGIYAFLCVHVYVCIIMCACSLCTDKLLPADPAAKWETCSWLMWQMGGLGGLSSYKQTVIGQDCLCWSACMQLFPWHLASEVW
jgi:hypothetical protein